MRYIKNHKLYILLALCVAIVMIGHKDFLPIFALVVFAHCDTMDGPVITNAKKALDTNNPDLVLIWVRQQDEQKIRDTFEKTVTVRNLSPQAKELADSYFFETLVRIHRAGEGEPYAGIKPAGTKIEPSVIEADKSIEKGSADSMIEFVTAQIFEGIKTRFNEVIEKKKHMNDSVAAGREYVESYVAYVHYIEKIALDSEGKTNDEEGRAYQKEHHHED